MSALLSSPSVTAVSLGDSKPITAFFDDLPGLVIQGNSHDEVKNKLDRLLKSYIDRLQSLQNYEIQTQTIYG